MTMTAVRDGIPVVRVANTGHTACVVAYLAKKAFANELDGHANAIKASASGYAGLIKSSRKRSNMDTDTTWQCMLGTITGVSAKKAKYIVDKYPTPNALCGALSDCSNQSESDNLLSEIQCGEKKLGKALSKRIANIFVPGVAKK